MRSRRGYTLIEVVVVIGIVGIIAAIAIPVTTRVRERSRLNDAVRELQEKVTQARTLAATPATNGAWAAPNNRVISAGIRITSQTQYTVFIDHNLTDGDEVTAAAVDFNVKMPGSPLRIIAPAALPATIRMRNTGQLDGAGGSIDVTIQDIQTRVQKTVRVSLAGSPRIL